MATEIVYNRIAMLRAERGISRRALSDALGVHYQTVGYLERGEYSPSLYLALRIAAYFEVPVEVIFSTEPFPRLGSASVSALASVEAGVQLPEQGGEGLLFSAREGREQRRFEGIVVGDEVLDQRAARRGEPYRDAPTVPGAVLALDQLIVLELGEAARQGPAREAEDVRQLRRALRVRRALAPQHEQRLELPEGQSAGAQAVRPVSVEAADDRGHPVEDLLLEDIQPGQLPGPRLDVLIDGVSHHGSLAVKSFCCE